MRLFIRYHYGTSIVGLPTTSIMNSTVVESECGTHAIWRESSVTLTTERQGVTGAAAFSHSGLVSPHSTLVRSKRLEESFPASQREMGRNGAPAPTRNGFYRGPF